MKPINKKEGRQASQGGTHCIPQAQPSWNVTPGPPIESKAGPVVPLAICPMHTGAVRCFSKYASFSLSILIQFPVNLRDHVDSAFCNTFNIRTCKISIHACTYIFTCKTWIMFAKYWIRNKSQTVAALHYMKVFAF